MSITSLSSVKGKHIIGTMLSVTAHSDGYHTSRVHCFLSMDPVYHVDIHLILTVHNQSKVNAYMAHFIHKVKAKVLLFFSPIQK